MRYGYVSIWQVDLDKGQTKQCQTCGAIVFDRDQTDYDWERLAHGSQLHDEWHKRVAEGERR